MRDKIKKKVAYYVRKYNTRDPFRLANALNVEVQIGNTGSCCGCYMFLKNHRYIFLNQELEEQEANMVLAHELGHAVMHRKQNCYFLREKTLLLPGIEREANLFAAELLIPEETILEYPDYSIEQLARLLGYREQFVKIKLRNMR
ncbi:ImmA/IrrE family metallo-endopeptidase [Cuneatibacter sp. NSJ-177]|uniref:ImmA/IrrE family metallo-endopeptidase n=1 Tax=Cuneatibacter sp. NSJ-177 TaxID=2931401 RepID=UPI001FD57B44|nr:ImmA/IrrE family metallo-endopeptidase [Cuneatibacter sp. NSJ-177]MCJ7837479.1 ImmA/IrrE family metallo-endopeptidase [Cuneatibacter sp. NSJ-177]